MLVEKVNHIFLIQENLIRNILLSTFRILHISFEVIFGKVLDGDMDVFYIDPSKSQLINALYILKSNSVTLQIVSAHSKFEFREFIFRETNYFDTLIISSK